MAGGTFKVLLELEKNAPFSTVAALHNLPGIADIHLDFDQFNKKPRLKQLPPPTEMSELNGHREHRKTRSAPDGFSPGKSLMKIMAANKGPMTRADIRKLDNGARMAANITALVNAKKLRKIGPGEYDLTAEARRELARAARETPQSTGSKSGASSAEKLTGAQIILGMLKEAAPLTRSDLAKGFTLRGKSQHSVGDQVDKLIKSGQIKRHPKGPDFPRGAYVLAEA